MMIKKFVCVFLLNMAWLISAEPLAVYLTCQSNPQEAMTVQWITPIQEAQGKILFKGARDNLWHLAEGEFYPFPNRAPFAVHRLELTNLQSDSEYIFRIGDEAKEYKFLTLPNKLTQPITFIEGGDVYHDGKEVYAEMNELVARHAPRFVVLGGDLAYASNRYFLSWEKCNRWLDLMTIWSNTMIMPSGHLIPLIVAIGNHEVTGRYDQTPEKAPFFYTLFPMQGYQVLDVGNYLNIFLLDSGHTHPIEGAQTDWLRKTLRQREHIPFKFAFYHVPAFPSVRGYNNKRSSRVRKCWPPLFEQFEVLAAFEHHEHAYKRTHPILQAKASSHGVVYFGDGCWGVEKPRKPRDPKRSWYLAKTDNQRHFISVTLCPNSAVYYRTINAEGAIIDEYSQRVPES